MRVKITAIALLILGSLVLWPTGSSASPSDQRAIIIVGEDAMFDSFNPCTGELVTVTFTDLRAVLRSGSDGGGGNHQLVVVRGNWTAGEFEGRFEEVEVVNSNATGDLVQHNVLVSGGSGPEGHAMTRFVATLRRADGVTVLEVRHVDAACRGAR